MDRESFLETIRKQYADKIQNTYVQCEHEHDNQVRVDWTQLHRQLTGLMKSAKVDGLAAKEFMELVKAELPEAWPQLEPYWFKVAA